MAIGRRLFGLCALTKRYVHWEVSRMPIGPSPRHLLLLVCMICMAAGKKQSSDFFSPTVWRKRASDTSLASFNTSFDIRQHTRPTRHPTCIIIPFQRLNLCVSFFHCITDCPKKNLTEKTSARCIKGSLQMLLLSIFLLITVGTYPSIVPPSVIIILTGKSIRLYQSSHDTQHRHHNSSVLVYRSQSTQR